MALYQSRLSNRSEVNNNNNNNNTNNNNNIHNSNNGNSNSNNQISCDNNSYIMPVTVTTTTNESFANIGGPTQTTSTLTPTTLKNIEESFMEIIPRQPVTHQHMAGFVPPLVNITSTYATLVNNNTSSNNSNSNSDMDYISDEETEDSSSQSQWSMSAVMEKTNLSNNGKVDPKSNKVNGTKTRGTSGRKPMRNDKLTPEEERKREQRRERNKQAAARCRKRRMDHTNQLLRETDGLEEKRQALYSEIEALKSQKEELEFFLETHKSNCKLSSKVEQIDIKPIVSNGNIIMNSNTPKARPNSLPISCGYSNTISEVGIPIQTPSAGLYLESMEGTGLTPILNSITPASITPSSLLNTPTITSSNCNQQKSLTTPNVDCSEGGIKLVPL